MRRLWPIVRREYLERVRSRAFIVSTFLGPLIMSAFMILPGALMSRQSGKALRIAIVDASGTLAEPIAAALAEREEGGERRFLLRDAGDGSPEELREALRKKVLAGSLDGYLYLPADAIDGKSAEYSGRNVSNFVDLAMLEGVVKGTIVHQRLARAGLPSDRIDGLLKSGGLKKIRLSAAGDREDRGASFVLSMIFLTLLYMTLAVWGAALMNGVIEEKANRVVEVIVSSVSPQLLFAGKLLGVGAAGLTQLLVWVAVAGGLALLGLRTVGGGLPLPEIQPYVLVFFVVFFVLGYLLYGSLYASVGASVNSQQEAQSLVFLVMMPLISGFILSFAVMGRPDSTLSTVLSFVPFWTPLLMFLRVSSLTPPAWQIATSIALVLLTIAVANWAASRIYRIGILMYGKRPTFPEILKWVRTR